MRTHHKDLVKRIFSLEQGFDGSIALCYGCSRQGEVEHMQIHHKDHIESHNEIDNLAIMHQNCNNHEHARWRLSKLASVREESLLTPPTRWVSREGEKGELMRKKWNAWLCDNVDGPFAKCIELPVKDLAALAVHALDIGSSVTYRRYITEDALGGYLTSFMGTAPKLSKRALWVKPGPKLKLK